MEAFQFHAASLPGLTVISPFYASDQRGWFQKTYEHRDFTAHNISFVPSEAFYTHSKKGTVRGLHLQWRNCQDKLVQVLHGAVFDVAVDLRKDSPTFGNWEGFYLNAENRQMLYIPKGFAHGFLALEENTLFSYLCSEQYDPKSDGGIIWNDPQLKIQWPLDHVEQIVLSDKDRALPTFDQFLRKNDGGLKGV